MDGVCVCVSESESVKVKLWRKALKPVREQEKHSISANNNKSIKIGRFRIDIDEFIFMITYK